VTNAAGRLLIRVDRAAGGLAADLALYGLAAAFALITALTSTLLPHRAWGAVAAWAYLAAFLLVGVQLGVRRLVPHRLELEQLVLHEPAPRDVRSWPMALTGSAARAGLTELTWVGAALVPLVAQAVQRAGGRTDRAQEEVVVVEHAGARLLDTGTPYLGQDAIAALPPGEQLLGYLPYQPGMAIFGLPRALAGNAWWTDARVWFALVTAVALLGAVAVLQDRYPRALVRGVQAVTVLPICALTLATGGDDLPVLALCLLALACCAADRFGAAGVAVGAAAALKLFAFPVLMVLAVLALATGHGRRFLTGAVLLPVLALLPAFLVDPGAFVENVIRFPLGEGLVTSPAQSPFPGYLISTTVPGGRWVAAALLAAVAGAIAVRLLRRPPRTAAAATIISGYGLLAAILLMPTTRFGYLLYPIALLVWVAALRAPASTLATDHPAAALR
jgi:hypothetical protein